MVRWGSFPVRSLRLQRGLGAIAAGLVAVVAVGRAGGMWLGGFGVGVVGSMSARIGVGGEAAAVVDAEGLGRGREWMGRVAVAGVGLVVGRRVLGLRFGELRVAVAVAAGRRSRRMLRGRRAVETRCWGSSSGMCAMARIGMRAASSGVRIVGAGAASESGAGVVGLRAEAAVGNFVAAVPDFEVGRPVLGFESMVFRALAGRRPATFCSCQGKARDTALGLAEAVGTLRSHLAVEEAVRSCQIAVHFQSSSFPYRLEGSSAQQRRLGTCLRGWVRRSDWSGKCCLASPPACGRNSEQRLPAWSASREGCRACS